MKNSKVNKEKLSSSVPSVRYGYARQLLDLAKMRPAVLSEDMDFFIEMTKSHYTILKWVAIDILGHLAAFEKEDRLEKILLLLTSLLHDGDLITANHAIFALGQIALYKPARRTAILHELLSISDVPFKTHECKAIAIGKVTQVLTDFYHEIGTMTGISEFIRIALASSRPATRKKANLLLHKMDASSN